MKISDSLLKIPGINRIISAFGIDKAIFYTILSVVWSSIAGILGIFFIVNYLSLEQQGYWYTFLSLGALATFAELGFTTIITQFLSHEYAHLKDENGKLSGDSSRIDRTVSLVKFSFKFYLIITTVAFLMLSVVGVIFLMNSTTSSLPMLLAWVAYSFTGAFLLLVSLLGAVLKGFNQVSKAQKIITFASFASSIATWVALMSGLNLWALAIGGLANIIFCSALFFSSSSSLWSQLYRTKVQGSYSWLKETLPLQWRYAISWASGYFIFQFIVPVTMFYAGADIAGKLGLSLVIARAVQYLANSWGITKVPEFNMLVAQKERSNLDNLLKTIQKQSLVAFTLGSLAVIVILIYIFPLINWSTRVLPTYEIVIILIAEGANLIVFNWAYYLRSHKEEPFMRISAISALAIGFGVWLTMYIFASTLIALSAYCVIVIVMLIPAWRIFVKKRREYNEMYGK
jgi:O-antigen/teichoic acid export membrane protein